MSTKNTFVNEPDRVIIYDDLGHGAVFGDPDIWDDKPKSDAFLTEFEVIEPRGHFMSDPNEDFYQGISVMAVIKRKSDGRLFGFPYWTPISKHADVDVESNGHEHGLEFDPPAGFDWNSDYYPTPYVWLPIEPFTIIGYKITKKESN
jgi:hypothetical protein